MLKTLWRRIDEPRVHRILTSVKYLLAVLLGAEYIHLGYVTLTTPGLYWSAILSGVFIILGSILGSIFALSKRWIWERPALIFAGLGGTISLYVTMSSALTFNLILGVTTLVLTIMYLVSLLDRYIEIRSDDREITQQEIEREADEIIRRTDK